MPQSWNRYSYALNSPFVYTDPSGEKWLRSKKNPDSYIFVTGKDYLANSEYYDANYTNADGALITLGSVPNGSPYRNLVGSQVYLIGNVFTPIIERCGACTDGPLEDASDHIIMGTGLLRGLWALLRSILAVSAERAALTAVSETVRSGAKVSVSTKVTVDRSKDVLNHIFKNQAGHLSRQLSAANKERYLRVFEAVGSNPANKISSAEAVARNFIRPEAAANGVHVFTKTLSNGRQVWVAVRNGIIRDAGINTGAGVR